MKFFNRWRKAKEPPPMKIAGLRVQVGKNEKMPKDIILFCVHPEHFERVLSEIRSGYLRFLQNVETNGDGR